MAKPAWKPWHEVVKLRDDVRTGELSLATFATDLHQVVMGEAKPVYQDPKEFFALTYPTYNLRELSKETDSNRGERDPSVAHRGTRIVAWRGDSRGRSDRQRDGAGTARGDPGDAVAPAEPSARVEGRRKHCARDGGCTFATARQECSVVDREAGHRRSISSATRLFSVE